MKHGIRAESFILRHSWTFVILRLRSWNLKVKNTKEKLYSEVTLFKDDSGSYAVFTEQGSSASQMTAAKIMDVVSRLPGCAGQAADAVSVFSQVKKEDAPTLLKNSKIGMSRHLDSSTTTQVAKIMVQYGRSRRSS